MKRKARKTPFARGSASTSLHAAVDPLTFYSDILPFMRTETGSVIIDFGGGIGRDGLALHQYTDYMAEVFTIEPDLEMWKESKRTYPGKFEYLETSKQYEATAFSNPPYYINDSLPDLKKLDKIVPGLKADFSLCNAVMMFIPPDQRETSIESMLDHVAPEGHLLIRYRDVDLKDGMYPISIRQMMELSLKFNTISTVEFPEPAPDPKDRMTPDGTPYLWHQILFTKLENI